MDLDWAKRRRLKLLQAVVVLASLCSGLAIIYIFKSGGISDRDVVFWLIITSLPSTLYELMATVLTREVKWSVGRNEYPVFYCMTVAVFCIVLLLSIIGLIYYY